MFKKIISTSIVVTLLLVLGFLINPYLVEAQGIVPTASGVSSCKNLSATECGDYEINDFIVLTINISRWILGIVGSLTLVMFVWGGVMFIISGGASDKISQAKKIIVAAIVGLIIVFSSWLIINFSISTISDKQAFQLKDGSPASQ